MAQGFHYEGQESLGEVYFRGATQPDTTDEEFKIRLANPLLIRVTGSALSGWTVGETVEGSTSSNTGVIEAKKLNGDSSVTLKLSGIGEAEVFSVGETVTGQSSGESGTLSNGNLTLGSVTNGDFVPNEQVEDQSTGATADIKTSYGNTLEINNITGDFDVGNSVVGAESGATATIGKHYAGIPGLFPSDTPSEIVTEATNYTPQTLAANATDWETKGTDITGDYYFETKSLSFLADGGDLGPVNLAILTVTIGTNAERIISSSPLQGSPPSKVVTAGSTINLKYRQALGV